MTKEQVLAWKAAAIADGWAIEPTYSTESVERAARLTRDGFVVSILTREPQPKPWNKTPKPEYSAHAWGPDGLFIAVPHKYLFSALQMALSICLSCHGMKPHVQRVGFAGRCCDDCLAEQRAKNEFPGWTD